MAEAKLITPEIGKMLAKVEGTKGTKEALTNSDAVFFEEFAGKYDSTPIKRNPKVTGRHGVKTLQGSKRVTWSGKAEVAIPDQFDTSTNVPHCDWLLRAMGFAREDFSTATHEAALYVLDPSPTAGISFEAYDFTTDKADANYLQGRGAVCGGTITCEADERVMLNATDGKALVASTPSNTYQGSSAESRAVTYYSDDPFLADEMAVELINLSNDDVYGGGSPGSPSGNFRVLPGWTINLNETINEQRGVGASGGIARMRQSGNGEAVTLDLTIEEALLSDASAWDPYALRDDCTFIELRAKTNQNDATGSDTFLAIHLYGQIVAVDKVALDGRNVWNLTIEIKYPEDVDGDPAVGTSPTQVFKYNAARGLYIDVTPTKSGVLAIMLARDSS
jgi:predicted Rdx family selenoprotein